MILLLWVVVVAAVVVPVFMSDIPPLLDYYFHLARMRILIDSHDPVLAQFYTVRWSPVPNLAMDLVVPPIARLTGLEPAGRLFVAASLVLILTGVGALHYALYRRAHLWPLAASLLAYNWVLLLGFVNYLFTLGLALWAAAAWVWLRDRPAVARVAVGSASALVLYIGHLYALGLYGLALGCYEAGRLVTYRPGWRAAVRDPTLLAVPFVLPAALQLFASPIDEQAADVTYRWLWKLKSVPSVLLTGYAVSDLVLVGGLCLLLVLALARGWLQVHPLMRLFLPVSAVVFVVMPWRVLGSDYTDHRLPIAVLLVAVASIVVLPKDRILQAAAAALLGALLVVRLTAVGSEWARSATDIRRYRADLGRLTPGAILFTAATDALIYYPFEWPSTWRPPLRHVGSLALLEQPLMVPQMALSEKQIVHLREPYWWLGQLADGPTIIRTRTPESLARLVRELNEVCDELPGFTARYLLVLDPREKRPYVPPETRLVFAEKRFYVVEFGPTRPPRGAARRPG